MIGARRVKSAVVLAAALAVTSWPESVSSVPAPAAGPSERPAVSVDAGASASGSAAASEPVRASAGGCEREPPVGASWLRVPTAFGPLVGETGGAFGSATIGSPTRGALWDGVELKSSDAIERAGGYPFGTATAVASIERAVRQVRRCHADTPRLYVGDLSREHGGWLRPHRSHQSGLDADLGYYYRGPATWYQRATATNLDAPRTWSLVKALIEGGNVDTIFIDRSIQNLLKAYVATLPEGERPPDGTFQSPTKRDAIIQHAWGHATHLHVRFRDEDATSRGQAIARMDPLGKITRGAVTKRR